MNHLDSVPTTWDDARDGQFFRIGSHVLPAHLVAGSSALLAANDVDLATSV